MFVQDMFRNDINRELNAVIKVEQNADDVIEQEVREYVITKELKKHFVSFFHFYENAFREPSADIGVWISGFFGSGKSHFLKMLSFLLQNREIQGIKTIELFREKFEDDPAFFNTLVHITQNQAEPVLFNIDVESPLQKDNTAILRVFAKVFYKQLGFYGEDLKIALLEKHLHQIGKSIEFKQHFEQISELSWTDARKAYAFHKKAIVQTLKDILGMSEDDAQIWMKDTTEVNYSIAQLVDDIKSYVNTKPADYRLIFMIDEVGQYIGQNTSLLLNLQSIVEKLGSECLGKVWVVCTGQETIEEIVNAKKDEFSRIQARFKTRLTLSSSSLDEVIQKRLLKKKSNASKKLISIYRKNDSILNNLFAFSDTASDIRGYNSADAFSDNFPFVPYQFILLQRVLDGIQRIGNAGRYFSQGERSMLSCFQAAAQTLCSSPTDEFTIAPFYLFYDPIHPFLDETIRRVIERCQLAAELGRGVVPRDVCILKLLFLLRCANDIPSKLENIAILMADDIRTDKIKLRSSVLDSLKRLINQNYIALSGDCYQFLNDEEQNIQREILNTPVDAAAIVERISQIAYGDLYPAKKIHFHKRYAFNFDKYVDDLAKVSRTGLGIHILTSAIEKSEKSDISLLVASKSMAIVALDEDYGFSCYESLENAMKIQKYIKQRNVSQLPPNTQIILEKQMDDARRFESAAVQALTNAILNARFFVDGERKTFSGGEVKSKLDQALEYLAGRVYHENHLISTHCDSPAEVEKLLSDTSQSGLNTQPTNADACSMVIQYLDMQAAQNLTTSMADLQNRYRTKPYGWLDIDIAAVVAQLIREQKVALKYADSTNLPKDKSIVQLLTQKNETSKTTIFRRERVSSLQLKLARAFLREYFDVMDVPETENRIVAFAVNHFQTQIAHYQKRLTAYESNPYPDKKLIEKTIQFISDILSLKQDHVAFIAALRSTEDDLLDAKEDMQYVEDFFKNQVQIFDAARSLISRLDNDMDYLSQADIHQAVERIRFITTGQKKFNYRLIPELNSLMPSVTEGHKHLLHIKQDELFDVLQQCVRATRDVISQNPAAHSLLADADACYEQMKQRIDSIESLALLDALKQQLVDKKDHFDTQINTLVDSSKPSKTTTNGKKKTDPTLTPLSSQNKDRQCFRSVLFHTAKLKNQDDIDQYLEQIRTKLSEYIKDGTIDLK